MGFVLRGINRNWFALKHEACISILSNKVIYASNILLLASGVNFFYRCYKKVLRELVEGQDPEKPS
jgi:hypothetical protein